MIRIRSNIGVVSERILKKLDVLKDRDRVIRPVCFDMIDLMTRRIHIEGKNASDQQIGAYKNTYLGLRQKKFNRSSDSKIIVSLTRQLENDWSVIATDRGYGVGFLNAFSLQKARWVEENKNQKIFSLSENEKQHAITQIQEITKQILSDS